MDTVEKPSFVLATPTHSGNVECGYTLTMIRACMRLQELGWLNLDTPGGEPQEVHFGMGGWTANARNALVARAIACPTATHILFVDSDIIAPGKSEIERLCRHACEVGVVGSFYPRKRTNLEAGVGAKSVKELATKVFRDTWPHETLPDTEVSLEGWGRRVQVTDYLPAGFMAVRLTVFERMRRHFDPADKLGYESFEQDRCWPWFNHPIVNREWWGEDVDFCRKWVRMGGEVWKIVDPRLAHVGKMVF